MVGVPRIELGTPTMSTSFPYLKPAEDQEVNTTSRAFCGTMFRLRSGFQVRWNFGALRPPPPPHTHTPPPPPPNPRAFGQPPSPGLRSSAPPAAPGVGPP